MYPKLAGSRHGPVSPLPAADLGQNGARQESPLWTFYRAPFSRWKAPRFPANTLSVQQPWPKAALGTLDSEAIPILNSPSNSRPDRPMIVGSSRLRFRSQCNHSPRGDARRRANKVRFRPFQSTSGRKGRLPRSECQRARAREGVRIRTRRLRRESGVFRGQMSSISALARGGSPATSSAASATPACAAPRVAQCRTAPRAPAATGSP